MADEQTEQRLSGGRNSRTARQTRIAEHVLREGSVSASSLSELFGVSLMTVHRDLDELERQGVVRKFRGGVSAQPSSVFESNVAYRLRTARAEKVAIGRYARTMIEPGMAVMLDDSTTTLEVAQLLPDAAPLTVITNFLEVIKTVSRMSGIRLIALGGEYYPTHDSFLGVPCMEAIESLRADVLFTSTSAVSATHAYHQEQEIVLVKRAMMRSAERKVLLIDHGKLGGSALHQLAPLTDFDDVVVDAGAPGDVLRALRDRRINVHIADPVADEPDARDRPEAPDTLD
ncbi:DeoR/GlpR family DNA-binding transcription regulator [Phytoactinopolyspora halotolerans]|uniref:DeoR/GlpR transcriptional regulator n=1 Tax=Phytoactinopolyspora halotolerans TaxID=1981512 RepID=A0A6L9S6W1_9ACTN|nr:DeoR/GlpR family DNA-binding transcription regulator [Phytoactinopolyspora halotolerans]NEE00747.1 DeoR/GlpR transcriptional regulator [Phytoactinopolyspora halotolerans]